jgi:hypothetical protein
MISVNVHEVSSKSIYWLFMILGLLSGINFGGDEILLV